MYLANIKSQKKRNKQNEKKRVRNRIFRGAARTSVKKARLALESGTTEEARLATMEAVSQLDQSAQKGTLHKRNAARRKGRLMKHLAAIEKKSE
jgi:small subunit ribosomal protein S20